MAQLQNTDKPKRFYQDVTVVDAADGHGIELDGRSIKTPERNQLVVPASC